MTSNSETVWDLPAPLSVREIQVDADTSIYVRRHGNPDGPRLILSHGNGLAIDLYYPFWSLLADDFDLIIYDLRNHGWNNVSALASHNVPTLVSDHDAILAAIELGYGKKPQVGVFHSVSALVSLLSPTRSNSLAALMLFDPPICKPGRSHREFEEAAIRASGMARRRTDVFRRPQDLSDVLPFVPSLQRLVPGAFDLMARTTLRERQDGTGYELRCPPEYEAQMIDYASVYGVAVDFDALECPVKVMGADATLPYSYLPSLDMTDIMSVNYDFLPDTTHFMQLEKPKECAAALMEFLGPIDLR